MLDNAQILMYELQHFPFVDILEESVFKVQPLSNLHLHWRRIKKQRNNTDAIGYTDNLALRKLMQDMPDSSPFFRLYHRFVREVVSPLYGGHISYSNRPKMRIHLAGTDSVSKFHRDVDVTNRPDQINVFLPFTPCFGTNTIWCETGYGLGDYRPIELAPGQAYLFDGGYLVHGTEFNDTNITRCSLDFRFAISPGVKITAPWCKILSARPDSLGGDPLKRNQR